MKKCEELLEKKCLGCGDTKPVSEFNKCSNQQWEGHQPRCRACQANNNNRDNPTNNAISKEMHRRMVEKGITRRDHYTDEHAALRKRLRAAIIEEANVRPANTKTPPPKRRVVPEPRQVTREVTWWDQGPTSSALRHNLWMKWKVCEFTGAEKPDCDESHILSRELCLDLGHPEWIKDEENCIFIFSALNTAMTRQGYWLHPTGLYLPAPGADHAEWMVKLGVVGKRIEMTEKRSWYAGMAAPICIL